MSPVLITIMLVSLSVNASGAVALPMLPLFIKELILNVSEEAAFIGSSTGIVIGVGSATSALAAVLVGKYAMRIGYWKTLIFCIGAGAMFTLPQVFVMNIGQLTLLRAMAAFFIGGTAPVVSALIVVSSDKRLHGTIFGIHSSVTFVGQAVGPIIGTVASLASLRGAFLASAIVLFIAVWVVIMRRKKYN
jgi:DHA1 family multidrug resistance protein-like MFS transporter